MAVAHLVAYVATVPIIILITSSHHTNVFSRDGLPTVHNGWLIYTNLDLHRDLHSLQVMNQI